MKTGNSRLRLEDEAEAADETVRFSDSCPLLVMPRFKRGIQYSATLVASLNTRRGLLDRPLKPGEDERSL
jgi:hypothetical protein